MQTKIIELAGGIRIEAEMTACQASTGDTLVDKTIDSVKGLLLSEIDPVPSAWDTLGERIAIEHNEIEFGSGIETSGNIFVASTRGNVNLKVKLRLVRPQKTP